MNFKNKIIRSYKNIAGDVEYSRQAAIKSKMPQKLRDLYASKVMKAERAFNDEYLTPNRFISYSDFSFVGGPYYLSWYEWKEYADRTKRLCFHLKPSYRLGFLKSKQSSLRFEGIRAFIDEIQIDEDVELMTYDKYNNRPDIDLIFDPRDR